MKNPNTADIQPIVNKSQEKPEIASLMKYNPYLALAPLERLGKE
jgi:hypothetical protein